VHGLKNMALAGGEEATADPSTAPLAMELRAASLWMTSLCFSDISAQSE
jgi:hypothetical protein